MQRFVCPISLFPSSRNGPETAPGRSPPQIGDCLNSAFNAVVRGSGRQLLGATFGSVTCWGVGLPTALYLGIKARAGTVGEWEGARQGGGGK